MAIIIKLEINLSRQLVLCLAVPARKGGKKTGQNMSDYPIPGGMFIKSCERLVSKGFRVNWIDRLPANSKLDHAATTLDEESPFSEENSIGVLSAEISELIPNLFSSEIADSRKGKSKSKYSCYDCGYNVWGKPGLNISCDDCGNEYSETNLYE